MALIKCPECELQVSDKAFSCPHCGYPFQPMVQQVKRRSQTKRKRLPNGFGQITEIKNRNLRKPFRAMVTVGFEENGKPISKVLKPQAYFETYNEAYEALLKYNKDPKYYVETKTFKEIADEFLEVSTKGLAQGTVANKNSQLNRVKDLWDKKIDNFTHQELKQYIIDIDGAMTLKLHIKVFMSGIFDYATNAGYIDSNPIKQIKFYKGELYNSNDDDPAHHISFTDDEMKTLWDNENNPIVKLILIQCYMGWRPQELCSLKIENVDIVKWTIIGGMKTKSGINRCVPIHTKIRHIIAELYNNANNIESEYLVSSIINTSSVNNGYGTYRFKFKDLIKKIKLNSKHRLHDCRVQFITMCKEYDVDEYAIKHMVGHSISDITESIYTKRTIQWLAEEVEKIKK